MVGACWENIVSTGKVVGIWRGRAILLMLVSVLVYSLAPLAVSWSGVSERPFLFSAFCRRWDVGDTSCYWGSLTVLWS